jgi:hypothetical protein
MGETIGTAGTGLSLNQSVGVSAIAGVLDVDLYPGGPWPLGDPR